MIAFVASIWISGCTESEKEGAGDSFVYSGPHSEMFDKVKRLADREDLYGSGEWHEHFGDGALFGPSFDLSFWEIAGEQRHFDRGIEALEFNSDYVASVSGNILENTDDLEIMSMSLLSLMRAGGMTDDHDHDHYLETGDPLLSSLDTVVMALGDYMDLEAGEFATASYGATSVTAFMALNHIEHVANYPDSNAEHHLERAQSILDSVHETAWSEEMSAYRFGRADDRLMLYPNITMMLAYAQMHQVTGEQVHLDRFYDIYAGIQPLKDESDDHYYSPYSFESMGATDPDYSTLSSQNYLMLALLSAYQSTADEALLEEVDSILGFIENNLMEGDLITHHWIDGRAASLDDPWYFCMGCNLQTLYILVLREVERRALAD